ncbi:MAG: GGDEF domain-containing protein [bacterium]|nr:GGDEF domain-containing protein [bacterium]
MFALVALVAALVLFALAGRVRATSRAHDEGAELASLRAVIAASRTSSAAVLETLARSMREIEPGIDAVLAFAPDGAELACVHASGRRVDHFARVRVPRDATRSLPARAALAGHRVEGSDGVMLPTDRHALAVPMLDGGGLRAVVYAASSSVAPRCVDALVRRVEDAACSYAIALEREADRADATYDGLTGLLTPRAFRLRLREEIARASNGRGAVLTLWFVDTDRFKSVNDTCGHASGDAVLQAMAALLRAHTVADVDLVGRNGGDEFCTLIFDAQKSVAIERAQGFCDAVRRHDFGVPIAVTASVGVASYPYDAADASALLEAADAAMYYGKQHGRDRVSFALDGGAFATYR